MMYRIISALIVGFVSGGALAQATTPIEVAANAPDRHIVKKGDTLWGIAGMFLKEPWRWPEVWRLNRDQINNPHRIYPGQVVILDLSGGNPMLRLGNPVRLSPQVYSEAATEAIPAIPQQIIEPFLAQPLIVDEKGLEGSPKIVAIQEDRVFLGQGNVAYVSGLTQQARNWQVYRPATAIKDPESGETLGYEAFYLGTARVRKDGEPAVIEITTAKQEIGTGDRLVPLTKPEVVAYAPHSPQQDIEGRVVSLYDGVNAGEAGRYQIITVNRGRREGLEIGHVLALYRNGRSVTYKEQGETETYKLPNERYGLIFVFRTFERISYALVLDAARPISTNDIVRKP